MILTVAPDEGLRLRVAAALRDSQWDSTVTNVASVGEVEKLLASGSAPSAVIVGAPIGLDGAIDAVAAMHVLPFPPPVLAVAQPTTDTLRRAMRGGVRDVLPPEFGGTELVQAFQDAEVRSTGPEALPGLTVAVFSTKGGVGTSVVAANLASRLATSTGRGVTLLDLDLASADQAIMHGLSPQWTVQDIADGQVGLDSESLRQTLLPVEGSAVRLLAGPVDPALAETITGNNVSAVIAAVRAESSLAVLDTASSFDDRTLAALDAADVVVVVSSLDVAALRGLTVSLETLQKLGIEPDRTVVTVVRSDSRSGLTMADIARAIGREVEIGIPSTRSVPRSVNEGVPIALSSPRSSVVSSFDDLVDQVMRHAPASFVTGDVDRSAGLLSSLLPWSRSRGSATDPAEGEGSDESHGPGVDVQAGEDDGRDERAEVVSFEERRAAAASREPATGDPDGDGDGQATAQGSSLKNLPPPVVDDDEDDDPLRTRRRR